MGRLTPLALLCLAGTAHAGPKRTVQIETKPPKASVYLRTTERGELCKTPCPVQVDGDTTLILQLDGYRPKIEQLVIGRREKAPYKRSYVLEAMIGQLTIEGPDGATVFIDGAEKGKIPFSEDVMAGKRAVVVRLGGRELYADSVEIAEDEESKITVSANPTGDSVAIKSDDGDGPDLGGSDGGGITKPGTPKPRDKDRKLFTLAASSSIGFRKFVYKNVPANTMREDRGEETELGQVLAGGYVEVWPGSMAGVRALRGFSLYGRFEFGVNRQTVVENELSELNAKTFWGAVDVSARQKWVLAGQYGIEVSAGYVRDQYQYQGGVNEIEKVPDVIYQAVRIGGRASLALGPVEPYAGFDSRIVMSGGPLQARFPAGADANGIRASAGVGFRFGDVGGGKIGGYLEGALTRYTWTFVPENGLDTDGATDSIAQVAFIVGYAY